MDSTTNTPAPAADATPQTSASTTTEYTCTSAVHMTGEWAVYTHALLPAGTPAAPAASSPPLPAAVTLVLALAQDRLAANAGKSTLEAANSAAVLERAKEVIRDDPAVAMVTASGRTFMLDEAVCAAEIVALAVLNRASAIDGCAVGAVPLPMAMHVLHVGEMSMRRACDVLSGGACLTPSEQCLGKELDGFHACADLSTGDALIMYNNAYEMHTFARQLIPRLQRDDFATLIGRVRENMDAQTAAGTPPKPLPQWITSFRVEAGPECLSDASKFWIGRVVLAAHSVRAALEQLPAEMSFIVDIDLRNASTQHMLAVQPDIAPISVMMQNARRVYNTQHMLREISDVWTNKGAEHPELARKFADQRTIADSVLKVAEAYWAAYTRARALSHTTADPLVIAAVMDFYDTTPAFVVYRRADVEQIYAAPQTAKSATSS